MVGNPVYAFLRGGRQRFKSTENHHDKGNLKDFCTKNSIKNKVFHFKKRTKDIQRNDTLYVWMRYFSQPRFHC